MPRPVAALRQWLLPASFLAPALIVLVAINVVPLFYTVTTSFEDYYLPKVASRHFNGLGNYAELLADDRFWGALGRTLLFVTVALAIEVALGFGVALMLIRQKRLVGLLRGFILLPIIITPIAVTFVWRLMFSPTLGLLNYFLSFIGLGPLEWIYSPEQAMPALILVEIWQHTPELMLIIFTGLLTLPKEVIEAAVVDGARASQIFFAIKLPLLRPILMVGVLFRTIDLFKTFDLFYILTRGGPGVSTETLAVYTYTVGFSFLRLGYGSALALVLFLIILAASFLIVRWGDVRLG
ncbi:MAG: sugar ABC transporter permease [Rhizobiales bacterium]|nr:sugar ABC transporter permease [Hyphomicrobiales bacterium]